ncbi:MAG: hypothetical protein HZA62_02435 [Rhodocyclales bacterium]|nr:hypothetical protein [Rhodocyclales bacterium]MBI5107581.1 hypothetical protein [Rhodocyclales bacterium]
MNTIVIEHVAIAELPEAWRKRLPVTQKARVRVVIEEGSNIATTWQMSPAICALCVYHATNEPDHARAAYPRIANWSLAPLLRILPIRRVTKASASQYAGRN